MKARFLVLGCAQDGAVPQLGCERVCCAGPQKRRSRPHLAPSVAIITPKGRRILIDASPDLRMQCHALGGIPDAILLTHAHMGHVLGLAQLGREAAHAKKLPVYGTTRLGKYLQKNRPFAHLFTRGECDYRAFTPSSASGKSSGDTLDFDGVKVRPFTVPHRGEDSDTVAFEIEGPSERLIYLPDHDDYSNATLSRLKAATTRVLDATFYSAKELGLRSLRDVPHPSIEASYEALKGLEEKTVFTHFNHTNPVLRATPERRRVLKKGFRMATEGMEIVL